MRVAQQTRKHVRRVVRAWARDFEVLPRPALRQVFVDRIRRRDFRGAHAIAYPEEKISLCIEMLVTNPDVESWPRTLGCFLSAGDNPVREYRRLCSILGLLHGLGLRVFDVSAARAAFDGLPEQVTVFRGTVEAEVESGNYGMCWTLDGDVAHRFANGAERIRDLSPGDTRSPAVILTAIVSRRDIAGMLFGRGESEILICPEKLNDVKIDTIKAVAAPGVIR